ncbi:hypothetical protein Ddc_03288 [Ditylenchus destructor]|nr:hypothetical protein Ddc_03288 [Ditylenchus destructor]
MTLKEDPHFDEIVNELKDIQLNVDSAVFGSVFLRLPKGLPEDKVPSVPEGVATLDDTIATIENTIERSDALEDRLKDLLEDRGNNASYEDQIEEYLRDLDESAKTLHALKPILTPEQLREGETGKTDVSWLSWRRNILGSKLHKEINELSDVIENESSEINQLETKLKKVECIIKTANTLQESAQYLAWFARRVVDYNESLPEFHRDFTANLVTQWMAEEANKVLEHHKNCINMRTELENKLEQLQ